ncbi:T9SS type A sorting domain-containing protein [Hymenobacter sp. B81]|uniref:T9SS type A sorting domain-containing protein n=1 Tax=Hymenobacter sp. B81 TaxID=3344878 RepID=UPI0037DCA3AC
MKHLLTSVFQLLGLSAVCALCPLAVNGQSTTYQDFDREVSTPQYNYISTGTGNLVFSNTYGVTGAGAGVSNGTRTLTFHNRTFTMPAAGGQLRLRVSAQGASGGEGLENTDYMLVRVSVNGGSSFSSELRIIGYGDGSGNRNVRDALWSHQTGAAATVTMNYDGNNTPLVAGPAGGGAASRLDGPSNIIINLPSGTTQAALQLEMSTNSVGEIWAVDNITLSANAPGQLPVELTSFTAARHGQQVRLAWATASEQNSARFEVQRSLDGKDFNQVGLLEAAGNSAQPRHYAFTDEAAPASALYYRLRQVDFDGTATLTRIVAVARTGHLMAELYPNPVRERLYLQAGSGALPWRVLAPSGKVLLQGTASGDDVIDVQQLAAGTYILELRRGRQREVHRFVHLP